MTETTTIVEALGGVKVLRKHIKTAIELSDRVREGLPYASLEVLLTKLRLPRSEAAAALNFPERTLARRKSEKRLHPDESDRVLRLARLFVLASRILESEENAATWFVQSNRALEGRTPLQLIDTETGAREVEEVLWRIAHGMFS